MTVISPGEAQGLMFLERSHRCVCDGTLWREARPCREELAQMELAGQCHEKVLCTHQLESS